MYQVAEFVLPRSARWQVVQLRMSCGKTTVEKSLMLWELPMMT